MNKFDSKRPNAPLLQGLIDPVVKEINDKYAPLHELKMQSKIEGIEVGFEQAAAEYKREYQANQNRLRLAAQKQRQERASELNGGVSQSDLHQHNNTQLPKRKSRLTDIGPNWRRALEQKQIQLANGVRGSQASFGTVY